MAVFAPYPEQRDPVIDLGGLPYPCRTPGLTPAAAVEPDACDPSAALFAVGDDLVAPPMSLGKAVVTQEQQEVWPGELEHNPDLITSLVADEATAGVVMSGRSGLDSSKLKLLAGLVPLARHLREPLDEIILVLLRRLRLFILRRSLQTA